MGHKICLVLNWLVEMLHRNNAVILLKYVDGLFISSHVIGPGTIYNIRCDLLNKFYMTGLYLCIFDLSLECFVKRKPRTPV